MNNIQTLSMLATGASMLLLSSRLVAGKLPQPDTSGPDAQRIQTFIAEHPGANVSKEAERIRRVYGRSLAIGKTAQQSADAFRMNHADLFGLEPDNLAPVAPQEGGAGHSVMYMPETDSYKFTAFFYNQELDGVPVFNAPLKLIVRNAQGFPLVLASANLRDLGRFQVNPGQAAAPMRAVARRAVLARARVLSQLPGVPQIASTRRVIWAGVDNVGADPRLADASNVAIDVDRWLIVSDAVTGEILYEEHRIYFVDIVGTVDGLTTQGPGPDICESEPATPLAYLEVTAGANSAFSDQNGSFVIPNPGSSLITVSAALSGQWFDVSNHNGADTTESVSVTPPGPADLVFNAANTDAEVRAQVNGYVHANVVRDFAVQANPVYPTITNPGFPVNVNRTDVYCPGNAWYSPSAVTINFCLADGADVNTAYSSIVYHEYGHHLVEAGGSGQGQYGEGMGDVMSALILDDPRLGVAFHGDCNDTLRSADNTLQYPCTSGGHFCGQLISGCVWDTRNEMVVTEPTDYTAILGNLAVNSILLHTGSQIEPQISIDFLTLDDDDADLANGTPHYAEICTGFGLHDMFGIEDSDCDMVLNGDDACPESILDSTIIIGSCDSGVENILFVDGCTMSDLIEQCAEGAADHGAFVSCVAHLTDDWRRSDLITGTQKGKVQSCAARARADLNADGIVGIADLLIMFAYWGSNADGPPDFDDNGTVDITDFLVLLGAWGPLP